MDYPLCTKRTCINWKDDHCKLKEPEKNGDSCLDFGDTMDAFRLRADAIKGTIS